MEPITLMESTRRTETKISSKAMPADEFVQLLSKEFAIITTFYRYETRQLVFSEEYLQSVLGYQKDELPQDFVFSQLFEAEDWQGITDHLQQRKNGLLPCRLLDAYGRWQHFQARINHRQQHGADTVEYAEMIFISQAAEGRAVKQVVQDEHRIHTVAEHMLQYGTYELDTATGTIHFSDGLHALYGHTDAQHKPTLADLQKTATIEKGKADISFLKLPQLTEDYLFGYELSLPDGSTKQVQCSGCIVNGEDGKPVKHIGLVRNITQDKNLEAHTLRQIDELERSNSDLEGFAYIASHDMQEPLRKISTFADRLAARSADKLGEEEQNYLKRIIYATDSMRSLIDNLLEYSRISKNKTPPAPVNLSFVLRQVTTELELKIEETGAKIEAEALPVIPGIGNQMQQLFTNILGNALKFRKPGIAPHITIKNEPVTTAQITARGLDANKEYVHLCICDNGIGFDEEYANRIFQIFQRLHGKAEYPGSGIGLAICKKIAEQHGGDIYANNISGAGACFHILLPAAI